MDGWLRPSKRSEIAGRSILPAEDQDTIQHERRDDVSVDETKPHVGGTVALREPTDLPAGAVLTVTLEDVSKMDAMSETLGTCVIDSLEQLPVSFSIEYDSTLIVDEHAYGVRARVEFEGALLHTTDTHHPVLTRGSSNRVDLSLASVPTRGGT